MKQERISFWVLSELDPQGVILIGREELAKYTRFFSYAERQLLSITPFETECIETIQQVTGASLVWPFSE